MKPLLPLLCVALARLASSSVICSAWLAGCAGLLAACAATVAAAAPQPNVIVVLVDDMGWRDLSCQGSPLYETPHIDRLAASGMRFTEGYAACTVCSPTRAAMLTGQYPARLHITDWIAGHERPFAKLKIPEWRKYLPHEVVTVAERLKSAGYATASIGKWHLGDEAYAPEHHGFDINVGGYDRGQPPSYFAPYKIPTLPEGPDGEYLTDREAAESVKFIEANHDRPFFLYLPHYCVHTPIQAKADVKAKYEAKAQRLGKDAGSPAVRNGGYAAMVESVDDCMGRILDTLDKLGIRDRTAIIFTSDNGGLSKMTDNAPARAGKGTAYDGGVRVPLIVSWPGVTSPGATTATPAITPDIPATILDLTGVGAEPKQPLDGMSLAPVLRGESFGRDALYWHYPHYHTGGATPHSALRAGNWRLVHFYEDGRTELYDLAKDPGETTDLAAKESARAAELKAKLDAWLAAVGAQFPTPNPNHQAGRDQPALFHEPFQIEVDGRRFSTATAFGHAGPCVFDINGDGLDDLVVSDFSGTFRILLNRGTAGKPCYANGGLLEAGGVPAKVRIYCCIAAQPRFCDLDGDGLDDMLANSYDPGHCHFFKGHPDGGFAAGVELMDTSGAPVRAYPQQEHKSQSFGSFFAPVDWDDDGDFDLLIGCGDGSLKMRQNMGTAQAPEFAVDNVDVRDTAGDPLCLPHRRFCPTVADWNGDGRWDILSGSSEGGVWWFRNIGERGAPRFAAAECLVDPPPGVYSLSTRPVPGCRTQPAVADYDGDGRLDLIVGDYRIEYACKSDLSPEEMHTCDTLCASFVAASQAYHRKAKELEGKLPLVNDEAAWERFDKALESSEEKTELNRAQSALEEYIRPRLRQRSRLKAVLEDGSTEEREELAIDRGNVWVYLRR